MGEPGLLSQEGPLQCCIQTHQLPAPLKPHSSISLHTWQVEHPQLLRMGRDDHRARGDAQGTSPLGCNYPPGSSPMH